MNKENRFFFICIGLAFVIFFIYLVYIAYLLTQNSAHLERISQTQQEILTIVEDWRLSE